MEANALKIKRFYSKEIEILKDSESINVLFFSLKPYLSSSLSRKTDSEA